MSSSSLALPHTWLNPSSLYSVVRPLHHSGRSCAQLHPPLYTCRDRTALWRMNDPHRTQNLHLRTPNTSRRPLNALTHILPHASASLVALRGVLIHFEYYKFLAWFNARRRPNRSLKRSPEIHGCSLETKLTKQHTDSRLVPIAYVLNTGPHSRLCFIAMYKTE